MVEKEYYNGIDFVKFIMAIMVVVIHLTPCAMFGENINFSAQIMTRAAVPFFFCASGFFLKQKLDTCANDNEYYYLVKKYIKRILFLYIIWTIIYLPCSVFWIKNEGKSLLTYVKECLFDGSYLHLWYLPSLIVAVLLATALCKKIGEKYTAIISIVLYGVGLLDTCWYFLIKNQGAKNILDLYDTTFITTRNGLFFGFAFIMLGFRATREQKGKKTNILLLVVSMIGLVIEMYLLKNFGIAKNYDSVVFAIPVTYYLFCVVKDIKSKTPQFQYIYLRKMGVLLWFSHCWVDFTYSILCYNILHRNFNSMIRFGYTMVISLVICAVILSLQKREKLKWLSRLY